MNTKILKSALKMSGNYYDRETNTLYMTRAFSKKSEYYGTDECTLLIKMEKQYPGIKTIVYKMRDNKAKLTYQLMEKFIAMMPDVEANLNEYKTVKKVSLAMANHYKYVLDWFQKKYPHYEVVIVVAEDGTIEWDAVKMLEKAKAEKVKPEKVKAEKIKPENYQETELCAAD